MKAESQQVRRTVQYFEKSATYMIINPWVEIWVCVHCIEFMTPREQVQSLEAWVADLEKLRQRERFGEETLRDLGLSHPFAACSSDVKSGGHEIGGHQSEEG